MTDRLTICRNGDPIYDICMKTSFDGLKKETEAFDLRDHKICIVTDSNVAALYLEFFPSAAAKYLFLFFRQERKIKT